jgi:hypothetical protein
MALVDEHGKFSAVVRFWYMEITRTRKAMVDDGLIMKFRQNAHQVCFKMAESTQISYINSCGPKLGSFFECSNNRTWHLVVHSQYWRIWSLRARTFGAVKCSHWSPELFLGGEIRSWDWWEKGKCFYITLLNSSFARQISKLSYRNAL